MKLMLAVLFLPCILVNSAGGSGVATGETLWLPIVATRSNVRDALASADALRVGSEALELVETDDCGNLRKGLYVVVAGIHDRRKSAESAITDWRSQSVDDAYLRSCETIVPSRLSVGIPLLDASFTQRPIEAVNWDLEDAQSRVVALSDRLVALIIPRYENDPEDIREGLRIEVRLYKLDESRSLELSSDCIDPEFSLGATQVALTCVNDTAGTYLLHKTTLDTLAEGRILAQEDRCRSPKFEQARWVCQKESVNAEGELALEPETLPLH
jgi:hypothetical protein